MTSLAVVGSSVICSVQQSLLNSLLIFTDSSVPSVSVMRLVGKIKFILFTPFQYVQI